MTNRFLQISLACLVASTFASAGAQAKAPKLETTDTMIPSGDAGIQLFVRNKHPAGRETSPDKILLFVHGATYPAETAFDLPIEGVSMMDLIPPGVFDAWANATWATDPESSKQNPPMLRAPNGVVEDSVNYWSAGKALYDPGKITVPTLLLHAEWDADLPSYLAQGYFAQLKNTPYKRLIELSEGTHTVMMEKNRMQFFRELMGFLDEEKPLALK